MPGMPGKIDRPMTRPRPGGFRPEGSCRGGALAGSCMIVESPTGMPSEDSRKAGLPVLWVAAADRFAINARFAAAGGGAVLRCERRLPGCTAFASPKYPSPEIGLTRCSQSPAIPGISCHPDIQGSPLSRLWTSGAPLRRSLEPAPVKTTRKCPRCLGKTIRHPPQSSGTASMGHRCGWPGRYGLFVPAGTGETTPAPDGDQPPERALISDKTESECQAARILRPDPSASALPPRPGPRQLLPPRQPVLGNRPVTGCCLSGELVPVTAGDAPAPVRRHGRLRSGGRDR